MIEIKNAAPSRETKIRALSRADTYPGYDGTVEPRETHISRVVLTADRVYKLKEPVPAVLPGFLDARAARNAQNQSTLSSAPASSPVVRPS